MKERIELIEQLEQYAAEIVMGSDAGYHLRELIEALRQDDD